MLMKNIYIIVIFFSLIKHPSFLIPAFKKRAVLFVTALDELAKEGCSFAQFLSNYFVAL